MRKIHYLKKICLGLMGLAITSCLDLDPKADMGDNIVWNKADNFQLFANQFYGWTRDFQMWKNTYASGINDGPHSNFR